MSPYFNNTGSIKRLLYSLQLTFHELIIRKMTTINVSIPTLQIEWADKGHMYTAIKLEPLRAHFHTNYITQEFIWILYQFFQNSIAIHMPPNSSTRKKILYSCHDTSYLWNIVDTFNFLQKIYELNETLIQRKWNEEQQKLQRFQKIQQRESNKNTIVTIALYTYE